MSKDNFILGPNVKKTGGFSKTTGYGLNLNTPKGSNLIVLAGLRNGRGYEPFKTLLPHQVYQNDLSDDFVRYGWDAVYALPVRSDEAVLVAAATEAMIERYSAGDANIDKRYRLTKRLKTNVEGLVYGDFDALNGERAVYEFMQRIEENTKEAVQAAVRARDEEWEKKLSNLRAGLSYV